MLRIKDRNVACSQHMNFRTVNPVWKETLYTSGTDTVRFYLRRNFIAKWFNSLPHWGIGPLKFLRI